MWARLLFIIAFFATAGVLVMKVTSSGDADSIGREGKSGRIISRVLVAIVAVGEDDDFKRGANVRATLKKLRDAANEGNRVFDCILFDYSRHEKRQKWTDNLRHCQLVRNKGWTFPMFLRTLVPALVSSYDFVMILLDDVELKHFSFGPFLDQVVHHKLDMATPGVIGAFWNDTRPHPVSDPNVVGRLVTHFEVFVTVIHKTVWPCYWSLLDMEFDGVGGHIDFWVADICIRRNSKRMGVLDRFYVKHMAQSGIRENDRRGESLNFIAKRLREMQEAYKKHRGITLVSHIDGTVPLSKDLAMLAS